MKKLLYFTFIGGIGFVIDGGLLTLLTRVCALNIFMSRLVSFSVAVLATWYLNRTLVFMQDVDPALKKRVEYSRYLAVQIGGALINLFIFTAFILYYPTMKETPVIPLFFGAFFGLSFNFTGTRYWVYKNQRNKEFNV